MNRKAGKRTKAAQRPDQDEPEEQGPFIGNDPGSRFARLAAERLEIELRPKDEGPQPGAPERFARKPWWRIELDYLTRHDLSAEDLARKWGIDANFLRRHARSKGWNRRREQEREKLRRAVLDECSARTARMCVESLEEVVSLFGGAVKALALRLKADAEAPIDRPPIFETISVKKAVDPVSGQPVKTLVKRRSASWGSPSQRAMLRTYAEVLFRVTGLVKGSTPIGDDAPPGPMAQNAGSFDDETEVPRAGTIEDFDAALREALAIEVGTKERPALPETTGEAKP